MQPLRHNWLSKSVNPVLRLRYTALPNCVNTCIHRWKLKNCSNSYVPSIHYLPFILLAPWAFVLFVITMQAELEKDPFDVPHSESELVGGLETEYTGAKLAFLHLTRDVQVVFGSALVVELFLGGPYGPVFFGASWFWFTLWFVLKLLVVVLISEYITTVFARFRIDQVLSGNWRILLPAALLSLMLTVALVTWVYPIGGVTR